MKLKLGTRKSLLAIAQSSWVAREVERLNPGLSIELVGIETTGDLVLDVPLSKIEGKEFFVAELDRALLAKSVDFCVHSMKDLSLERPEEFVLGAIPKRANPRDIIIFSDRIIEKIKNQETITIGTSSPRRLENLPEFIKNALPRFQNIEPKIKFVEIRGNVNTRLSRVHSADLSKQLDAVVLALAGLIRLYQDQNGKIELDKLFKNTRYMIAPLTLNPTAPAQGALAIECRKDDKKTFDVLRKLHDFNTENSVKEERKILQEWGGGCHLMLGATSTFHEEVGQILQVKGRHPSGNVVEELRWNRFKNNNNNKVTKIWNGREENTKFFIHKEIPLKNSEVFNIKKNNFIFVAHSRAWPNGLDLSTEQSIWTSGTKSWFKLARQGIWVSGCAEEKGFEILNEHLFEPVLRIPSSKIVFTHSDALKDWNILSYFKAIATYSIEPINFDANQINIDALKSASHLFWSSASQFEKLSKYANNNAKHACGYGKTAKKLRNILQDQLSVFPNAEEWLKWLKV